MTTEPQEKSKKPAELEAQIRELATAARAASAG